MIFAQKWLVERREDGVVLVRVPSTGTYGGDLPDAVFSFRAGDPQYDFWQRQLRTREESHAAELAG
jgi:hypothetical protein